MREYNFFTSYKNIFIFFFLLYLAQHVQIIKVLNCFYQIVKKDLVKMYFSGERKVLLYFWDHLAIIQKCVLVPDLVLADNDGYFLFVLLVDKKRQILLPGGIDT